MKVYFAGREKDQKTNDYFKKVGVKYRLLSFYYILKDGWLGEEYFSTSFNHIIVDSGLFTLMFGAKKDEKMTVEELEGYKEKYFNWIATIKATNFVFVELDVQKVYSSNLAWEYRIEMKRRLPDKEIMNVYHLEDTNPDKLIAFSQYIAVSIPELKIHKREELENITRYIVNNARRKNKKVHLLGMSGNNLMQKFRHATTCDSTNWTWYARSMSYKKQLLDEYGLKDQSQKSRSLTVQQEVELGIILSLKKYKKYAGNQD